MQRTAPTGQDGLCLLLLPIAPGPVAVRAPGKPVSGFQQRNLHIEPLPESAPSSMPGKLFLRGEPSV